ncbi:hypothetical protein HPB49_015913 [Dermacentor silvarum]|uniref:Uncharacterized protein n=1 Tax=Dermacentor silvarum TaxID=543639 RepID=A0ACB8DE66_DERSI|nr:hypothetical protein HPB49_015913 [Dermacentor silvarum]
MDRLKAKRSARQTQSTKIINEATTPLESGCNDRTAFSKVIDKLVASRDELQKINAELEDPKLTLAKCRRNVENFLNACRQLGVPEEATCSAPDVLEERGLVRVAVTVQELFRVASRNKH